MHITSATLTRIAKETVQKRAYTASGLIAAYLTGSARLEAPLLGGATDIDITLIWEAEPPVRREIVPLTDEVHLDIIHIPRSDYDRPKELRLHPWLGPELYDHQRLHDPRHFLEFIQAGVRDKFHEPENVLERARKSAGHARQIWSGLLHSQETASSLVPAYLKAVRHAANAVALLAGGTLSERRFLLQFPIQASAAGRPGLADSLLHLLGADDADPEALQACLAAWELDFASAASIPGVSARIALPRLGYYKLACQSMLASESPHAMLWPLLLTWTLAIQVLPPERRSNWESACRGLGLIGAGFEEKAAGLDAFLDELEEMLENASE